MTTPLPSITFSLSTPIPILLSHPQIPALPLTTPRLLPRQSLLSETCPPSLLCSQTCCLPPSTCKTISFLTPFCQPPESETQIRQTCETGRELCPDGVSCCFVGFRCDSVARMCWSPSPPPLLDEVRSQSAILPSLPAPSQDNLNSSTAKTLPSVFNSMSFLFPPSNFTIQPITTNIPPLTPIATQDITSLTYPSPPFTSLQSTLLSSNTAAQTSEPAVTGGAQLPGKKHIPWEVLGLCFGMVVLLVVR